MLRRPRTAANERGVVLIWMAFMMIVFLMFVALSVDASKMAATRTQLQNVADAAALAGAAQIDSITGVIIEDRAIAVAQAVAAQNKAFLHGSEAMIPADLDIEVIDGNTVEVIANRRGDREVWAHIAQVINQSRNEMGAIARAKVEPTFRQCEDLVPMAAVPPTVGDFQTGCEYQYTLKQPAQGGETGNFLLLTFPDCNEGACAGMNETGANTMRCLVEHGYSCCIEAGQWIDVEPGAEVGPLRFGLNDRFDADTDRREDICYETYNGNGQRVINVPKTTMTGQGRSDQVQVLGFTAFFLRRRVQQGGQNSVVEAQFLYDVVPGSGGGDGDIPGTAFSIRLVK